ncbi:MAG: hypothetical protein QXT45_03445 [Candidatus Bilamarchaeaceae archaeon]
MDWVNDAVSQTEIALGRSIGPGERAPRWSLYGENAIVEKGGGSVVIRLLPRRDVGQAYKLVNGKLVLDEKAKPKNSVPFLSFFDHWFSSPENNVPGKRRWTVCPRSFGKDQDCPVCEQYLRVSSSDAPNKNDLKRLYEQRPSFAWAAIVGQWRKRRVDPLTGEIDVRLIFLPVTVHTTILSTLLRSTLRRNDPTDPERGFDIELFSPNQRGGRWTVQFGAECPMLDPQVYSPEDALQVLRKIPDLESGVKSWVMSVDVMRNVISGESGNYGSVGGNLVSDETVPF